MTQSVNPQGMQLAAARQGMDGQNPGLAAIMPPEVYPHPGAAQPGGISAPTDTPAVPAGPPRSMLYAQPGMPPGMQPGMQSGMQPGMHPQMQPGTQPGMQPGMPTRNATGDQGVFSREEPPGMQRGMPSSFLRPQTFVPCVFECEPLELLEVGPSSVRVINHRFDMPSATNIPPIQESRL